MSPTEPQLAPSRRQLIARGGLVLGAASMSSGLAPFAQAKDYTSRREALDALDRLAINCGMRLGVVGRTRPSASVLVPRFLAALSKHRQTRDDVRRRFALPRGVDPARQLAEVEADLPGLRQALDDLMIAYAESLPVFGDSKVVSRLAIDMVDVSRLRTVIDLWAEAEAA